MFDYMPAYHDVGGNVRAIGAIVAPFKLDSPAQISVWPDIARVEPIATIASLDGAKPAFSETVLCHTQPRQSADCVCRAHRAAV